MTSIVCATGVPAPEIFLMGVFNQVDKLYLCESDMLMWCIKMRVCLFICYHCGRDVSFCHCDSLHFLLCVLVREVSHCCLVSVDLLRFYSLHPQCDLLWWLYFSSPVGIKLNHIQ